MACSKPRTAYLTPEGKVTFSLKDDTARPIYLPCRRCELCLRARKSDLTVRLVMEGWSNPDSICATFTYSDDMLPPGRGLSKRDAQLLVKRIRVHVARAGLPTIRCHVVGEYSPKKLRPHLHVIVWNWFPADAVAAAHKSASGRPEFTSQVLTDIWGKGRVTFQRFSASAAAYVAKHQASKLRVKGAAELAVVDEHGNWSFLPPEFELRPLRPGLGHAFFEKHQAQLLALDFIEVDGVKLPLPQYINTLAKRADPDRLSELKAERALRAADPKVVANSTYERLAVREEVAKAKAKFFSRDGGLDG